MNTTLLAKWTIRFQEEKITGIWKDILIAKYHGSCSLSKVSPFWKAILKDKNLIELGFNKNVGSSTSVLFWTDRWFDGCALQYDLIHWRWHAFGLFLVHSF
jgi:hypothetical protein